MWVSRHRKRQAYAIAVIPWVLVATVPLNSIHRWEDAIRHATKSASFRGAAVESVGADAGGRVVDFQRDIAVSVEWVAPEREEVSVGEDFCCESCVWIQQGADTRVEISCRSDYEGARVSMSANTNISPRAG